MERRCWFVIWISVTCFFGGATPQYRDKNISRETDAVQEILARYLQKRLQGAQVFSPPPPAVLFNVNRQSRARKTEDVSNEADYSDLDVNRTESQERREDYDDYEDDLQGFEDREFSRTRINLFGSRLSRMRIPNVIGLSEEQFRKSRRKQWIVRRRKVDFNSLTQFNQ